LGTEPSPPGGATVNRPPGERGTERQPWLAAKIATAARKAKPGTCRTCGAPVLVGLDGDALALTATVDPAPVDPAGELRAVAQGLGSYTLTAGELDRRSPSALRRTPAPDRPVVIDHTCEKEF
jgi:hypothetical protein